MKKLVIMFVLLTVTLYVKGQIQVTEDSVPKEIISDKLYKFELRMPAQCIDKITYPKTGLPVEHELSDDGKTVYLRRLVQGQAIHVECTYKDGSRDAFVKSPCSLELVVPL